MFEIKKEECRDKHIDPDQWCECKNYLENEWEDWSRGDGESRYEIRPSGPVGHKRHGTVTVRFSRIFWNGSSKPESVKHRYYKFGNYPIHLEGCPENRVVPDREKDTRLS